jgi:predicted transcriptional regulator
MQNLSITEIIKELNNQDFKHVGLFTETSNSIIPYNNSKVPVKDRIAEIKKRLESRSLPDGTYIIMAKNSLGTKVQPSMFYILKGHIEPTKIEQIPVSVKKPDSEVSVISYERALELQTELAELRMKNEALERERDELLEELQYIDDNHLDDPGDLMSNSQKFLADLLPTVSPFIDKFFEQRDRQLGIEERRLDLMSNNTTRPAPKPSKPAPKQDKAAQFIRWLEKANNEENPYDISQLVNAYNSVNSLHEFEAALLEIDPDILELYTNFNYE